MGQVSTIGLDIAKRVFQVHGVDAAGVVVFRRQLRRTEVLKFFAKQPPCWVGIEACGSAHYRGREIAALGHQVRLMQPTRVKPYVKWGRKNDKIDAAACCEAVGRPSMRFVPLKTVEQQAGLWCTGPANCWSSSAPDWATRSAPTWPRSASWRPRARPAWGLSWRCSAIPRISTCRG